MKNEFPEGREVLLEQKDRWVLLEGGKALKSGDGVIDCMSIFPKFHKQITIKKGT